MTTRFASAGDGAFPVSRAARPVVVGRDVRLTLVMPAFNEEATVVQAVTELLAAEFPCPIELIVVDDGSRDATHALVQSIDDPRLTLIRHPRNLGKGAALLTGLRAATGTHLLPFDADLEYSPHDVARLLEPVIAGVAEVVYGTRLFGLNTRYHSFRYKMGNRATTLLANLLFDSAVTDMHTCLKLVPTATLRQMPLRELGFGLDSEITANVLRMGLRPFEVPVAYYARSHEQGKKINWKDGMHCVRVLATVRLQVGPSSALRRRRSTRGATSVCRCAAHDRLSVVPHTGAITLPDSATAAVVDLAVAPREAVPTRRSV